MDVFIVFKNKLTKTSTYWNEGKEFVSKNAIAKCPLYPTRYLINTTAYLPTPLLVLMWKLSSEDS